MVEASASTGVEMDEKVSGPKGGWPRGGWSFCGVSLSYKKFREDPAPVPFGLIFGP